MIETLVAMVADVLSVSLSIPDIYDLASVIFAPASQGSESAGAYASIPAVVSSTFAVYAVAALVLFDRQVLS